MPAHRNLLLHHTEAVEPAEQEAGAVHPQVEVHIITHEPAQSQRRGRVGLEAAHTPPDTWSVHPWIGGWEGGAGLFLHQRPSPGRHRRQTEKENRTSSDVPAPGKQGAPQPYTTEPLPPVDQARHARHREGDSTNTTSSIC